MAELSRLLDAVHLATQKLASTADTKTVLREVLSICVEAVGAAGGSIYIHEPSTKTLKFLHVLPEEIERKLERLDIPDDYGVAGEVFQSGKTKINVYGEEGDPHRRAIVRRTGVTVKNMITVPLQIHGSIPVGVVQLVNKKSGPFDDTDEAVLDTISDVATLAIQNSRMLERSTKVASLEGMGRAAHDLANKAGVLVTFLPDFERNLAGLRESLTEMGAKGDACFYLSMLEGAYADVFAPYSERVYRYAKLINDLAAGKPLVPKKRSLELAAVIREAAEYMETMARQNYVKLEYDLQKNADLVDIDDLYVIRIVENLVGNAIKAVRATVTPEWLQENASTEDPTFGKVILRYKQIGDRHVLQVIDNGQGMSPATIRQILAGTAKSGWDQGTGSGLGTKVVVELASALGAKLSIASRLGEGSTFEIDFPGAVPAAKESDPVGATASK